MGIAGADMHVFMCTVLFQPLSATRKFNRIILTYLKNSFPFIPTHLWVFAKIGKHLCILNAKATV